MIYNLIKLIEYLKHDYIIFSVCKQQDYKTDVFNSMDVAKILSMLEYDYITGFGYWDGNIEISFLVKITDYKKDNTLIDLIASSYEQYGIIINNVIYVAENKSYTKVETIFDKVFFFSDYEENKITPFKNYYSNFLGINFAFRGLDVSEPPLQSIKLNKMKGYILPITEYELQENKGIELWKKINY